VSVRRQAISGGDQVMKADAKRLARTGGESFVVRPGDMVTVAETIF
jgi:hypothetical protein